MPSDAAKRCLALAGLLALVAVSYWGILNTFFVQDDFALLKAANAPMPNAYMLRGGCFVRPVSAYWMPLLNVRLWGLDPFWHHLTYLALFLATIAVLFAWLREATGSSIAAIVGASLYAFSKTHLYTLAWIAGGIDVLAAFFFTLTLWSVSRYFRRCDACGSDVRWQQLAPLATMLGCALLSKESSVVLAPAILVWIVARAAVGRRRPLRAEWQLAAAVILAAVAYLIAWKILVPPGKWTFGFDFKRAIHVLRGSAIAIVPLNEARLGRGDLWLLLPLVVTAIATIDCLRKRRNIEHLAVGIVVAVLSAIIFVFATYPPTLQLYYSHFSVIGLAIVAALAARAIWQPIAALPTTLLSNRRLLKSGVPATALVCSVVWLALAAVTISEGIRDKASPALDQASLAKAAYDQLESGLRSKKYRLVVFVKQPCREWSSMCGTTMTSVLFPDVQVTCVDDDGSDKSTSMRTSANTLIVRVAKDRGVAVMR